jgi:putative sterol carrier protein
MAGFTSKEDMDKVLSLFVDKIRKSQEIAKRCKGIKVSLGYEMTDLDVKFHTEFMDGVVSGGLGEATPASMVILETDSETFDGMMTGEVDAASAAMNGTLSFSGDMSAAMGLQVMYDDMGKLYQQARTEALG